jgi:hypothetical protein
MTEKPKSPERRETTRGKVPEQRKDDPLEKSLNHLENIVENHYENLNLRKDCTGKVENLGTQKMKVLRNVISDIKSWRENSSRQIRWLRWDR